KKLTGKKPFEAMRTMRKVLFDECLGVEIAAAAHTQKVIGQIANQSALSQTIVALPISKELCLFQFDQSGVPEAASHDLPFVAVGSGQTGADPFLAFLRRIFWRDPPPNLAEGIFACWWALDHAIKTSPGGVAEPKQIVVLELKGSNARCREPTEAELLEHQEAVARIEKYLRDFRL